jgi:hypothetical protein
LVRLEGTNDNFLDVYPSVALEFRDEPGWILIMAEKLARIEGKR